MRARKFDWSDMPLEQVTGSFSRQMIVGENEMFCRLVLKPGCIVPRHSHIHEQISHVLKGRILFEIDGEKIEVGPGQTLLIPPNVPHGAEVVGDEEAIDYDIFSPIRRDWLDGTDDYLREKN
ncbi:MAG: cupin domain-containing protein [bacterium]|nr:cupin domain-containing protein [bacterium]